MYNKYKNNEFINKPVKKVKLVILGNSSSGKTCIVRRMIYNTFDINSTATIGAAYTIYNVEPNIRVEMWDTAGQERFHSLLPMYARGAEIVIVVIDIEKNIDEQILKWNKYIQDNDALFSQYSKMFLIFNKHDLNTGFEIPTAIVNQLQFTFITLVSAKTGHNIDKLKFHLELNAKKIVDECARRSHENASTHRVTNDGTVHGNSSNIDNEANGTIFGSAFSNMKMKVELQEYRESVKKYYENSRC